MKKYIYILIASFILSPVAYAAYSSVQSPYQISTSTPTSGFVLQSGGGTNNWVSTSSLNISGGGGTNYFTNSGATTTLTTGSILSAATGTFGIIIATSTTVASDFTLASTTQMTSTNNAYLATSGGNVSIGNADPAGARLQIQGAGGVAFLDMQPSSNTTAAVYAQANNAGSGFYFGGNNSLGNFNSITGGSRILIFHRNLQLH